MSEDNAPVLCDIDGRGVATVTLNRPQVNNAYNGEMVQALLDGVAALQANKDVRVIVIKGNGRHFQAGADLAWLESVRHQSPDENLAVSMRTTDAVRHLDECPIPTVALVHGGCFGGGTGIIAACDVVFAADNAMFSIAEVRWGLHAGPIIPQLAAAIGPRNVRRYAITAERFDAAEAARIGLVHEVVPLDDLEAAGEKVVTSILMNGPDAISETKQILFDVAGMRISDDMAERLAKSHSDKRQTAEGAEGLLSFHEKRPAAWFPD